MSGSHEVEGSSPSRSTTNPRPANSLQLPGVKPVGWTHRKLFQKSSTLPAPSQNSVVDIHQRPGRRVRPHPRSLVHQFAEEPGEVFLKLTQVIWIKRDGLSTRRIAAL